MILIGRMGNYRYFVLIFSFTLPCIISFKNIEQCNDVCKTTFRCPEKVVKYIFIEEFLYTLLY